MKGTGILEKKNITNIKNFRIKPKNGESLLQFEKRVIKLISNRKFEEKSFLFTQGVLKFF